ncbi:MAG: hypothetical protein RBT04_02050 [Sphaerochaetaceae bacterium]|jgi:hypothetical protein|nr:hypothetical protein [Sphaerochaetaceae bacterium]
METLFDEPALIIPPVEVFGVRILFGFTYDSNELFITLAQMPGI